MLFIDVNLGEDNMQRITVMKGDSVEEICRQFCVANELDAEQEASLVEMLRQQIDAL